MIQIFRQNNTGGKMLSVGNVVFYRQRTLEMGEDHNKHEKDPFILEEKKVLDCLVMDIFNYNNTDCDCCAGRWDFYETKEAKLSSVQELLEDEKVKELKNPTIVFNNKIVRLADGFDPGSDFEKMYDRICHYFRRELDEEPTEDNLVWKWNEDRKSVSLEFLSLSSKFSSILSSGLTEDGSFHDFLTKGMYDPRLTLHIAFFLQPWPRKQDDEDD